MSIRFKNKFRIDSARLRNWDYGWNACYFVTICTKRRIHFFGKIRNGEMIFNDIGTIADQCWMDIPKHFPFVKLGNHIVVPNHVHGIVVIDKPPPQNVQTQYFASPQMIPPPSQNLEMQNFASLPVKPSRPPAKNKFGPQSQNLPSIIRGFKTGVTIQARSINPNFGWQPRYHDHIIRNKKSYQRISDYIANNPVNWKNDAFNKF